MGNTAINGWDDLEYSTVTLTAGVDNTPTAEEYLVLVPAQNANRVVGFGTDDIDTSLNWMMEVANGDPTATMSILLIGGSPAQTPPQIVLPPGFSTLTLNPGYTQRVVFIAGVGWVPLFAGTLS